MLSLHIIEKAIETRDYDRLIRELTANGLDLPLPLRVRLSSTDAAGLALGLRRVVELTYGPTALSRGLTDRLLGLQSPHGGFGETDQHGRGTDLLATACVVAAFGRLLSEHQTVEGRQRVQAAHDRAIAALAAGQAGDGLFVGSGDRTYIDRVRHTAFVVMLLGDNPGFRAGVRWAELMTWFDEHADQLDPVTERFWEMARAEETARRVADAALGIPLAA